MWRYLNFLSSIWGIDSLDSICRIFGIGLPVLPELIILSFLLWVERLKLSSDRCPHHVYYCGAGCLSSSFIPEMGLTLIDKLLSNAIFTSKLSPLLSRSRTGLPQSRKVPLDKLDEQRFCLREDGEHFLYVSSSKDVHSDADENYDEQHEEEDEERFCTSLFHYLFISLTLIFLLAYVVLKRLAFFGG